MLVMEVLAIALLVMDFGVNAMLVMEILVIKMLVTRFWLLQCC